MEDENNEIFELFSGAINRDISENYFNHHEMMEEN